MQEQMFTQRVKNRHCLSVASLTVFQLNLLVISEWSVWVVLWNFLHKKFPPSAQDKKQSFHRKRSPFLCKEGFRATCQQNITPMSEVLTDIVAGGYVHSKTLHQYMKYEPTQSQWVMCIAQLLSTKFLRRKFLRLQIVLSNLCRKGYVLF